MAAKPKPPRSVAVKRTAPLPPLAAYKPTDVDLAAEGITRKQFGLAVQAILAGKDPAVIEADLSIRHGTIQRIRDRHVGKTVAGTTLPQFVRRNTKAKALPGKRAVLTDINAWRTGMFERFGADGLPHAFASHHARCLEIKNFDEFLGRILASTPEELDELMGWRSPDGRGLSAHVQAYIRLAQDTLSWDPKTRAAAMDRLIKLTRPVTSTVKVQYDDDPFRGLIDPGKARLRVQA